MEVDILNFIRKCKHSVKQTLGKYANKPAIRRYPRWKHIVIHYYRLEENYSFRETENRLKYMTQVRKTLELEKHNIPRYITIYKSFNCYKMKICRKLLYTSAKKLENTGHTALDSTFIKCKHASHYYIKRSNRKVKTIKVITLTDTK